jgi:hypothetical protein
MNTDASVVIRGDVCFCYSVTGRRKIIWSKVMQSKFYVKLSEEATDPTKRFRKRLVMIPHHVLKYFGGGETIKN